MNKKIISKKVVAMCLVAIMAITMFPVTSFAKSPTIDTQAQELTIGKNQLKMYDYHSNVDTLLGSFTAPESGKYNFKVINNGDEAWKCYLLNEDMEAIANSGFFVILNNGNASFTNWS